MRVGQFADVAGPVVGAEQRDGLREPGCCPGSRPLHVPGHQRAGQGGDVFLALAQRRQPDLERVHAEEQVFAEAPFGDHVLQVAIRRADDADIDVDGLVLADAAQLRPTPGTGAS